MARFYGTVQGGRGEASRLGHATSGLHVTARTWGESFTVRLWADEEDTDCGSVHLGGFCLFYGAVKALKTPEGRVKWIADMLMNKPFCAAVLHELATRGLLNESQR